MIHRVVVELKDTIIYGKWLSEKHLKNTVDTCTDPDITILSIEDDEGQRVVLRKYLLDRALLRIEEREEEE